MARTAKAKKPNKVKRAKPLKKATQRHRRVQRAKHNTRLAVVAALAEGMGQKTEGFAFLDKQKEKDQIAKIRRWAIECLHSLKFDDNGNNKMGVRAGEQATHLALTIEKECNKRIEGEEQNLGHLLMIWLMIGYLADEARFLISEQQRPWNYLASTVNTWVQMIIDHVWDDVYEERACELAERAREIIIREG